MTKNIQQETKSFDFPSYKAFMYELEENMLCTGELTQEHIQATLLNSYRIRRIDKHIEILPALTREVQSLKSNWEWIVLVESWCGDGAQNLPIIAKIAALTDKIKLTIKLRSENAELMDAHLTNGARSIPKLICVLTNSRKEIGNWGPRPAVIQEKVKKLKSENLSITPKEFSQNLHLWYASDKGAALQNEFINLIKEWKIISRKK